MHSQLYADDVIHIDFDIEPMVERVQEDEIDQETKNENTPELSPQINADQTQIAVKEEKPSIYYPGISGCRLVTEFTCLNRIEEGSYGVVYRVRENRTSKIFALKQLNLAKETDGFTVSSLREINMLLKCVNHPNIVRLQEVVVGSNISKVYMKLEYVEHNFKTLMELLQSRSQCFTSAQIKNLMRQLLSSLSNFSCSLPFLFTIGDFGMARRFGDPLRAFTPVVVTLYYRSPELLLKTEMYSTAVDIWSIGCIFGELFKLQPVFHGTNEINQLIEIFTVTGTPSEQSWPGYKNLWGVKNFEFKHFQSGQLYNKFPGHITSKSGMKLVAQLLTPCPERRINATRALQSSWFREDPLPLPSEEFPMWQARSEQIKKRPASAGEELTGGTKIPKMSIERKESSSRLNGDFKSIQSKTIKSNGSVLQEKDSGVSA